MLARLYTRYGLKACFVSNIRSSVRESGIRYFCVTSALFTPFRWRIELRRCDCHPRGHAFRHTLFHLITDNLRKKLLKQSPLLRKWLVCLSYNRLVRNSRWLPPIEHRFSKCSVRSPRTPRAIRLLIKNTDLIILQLFWFLEIYCGAP